MAKVRVTMGTGYCGCRPESIEFEIDGKASDNETWKEVEREALEMACGGCFANYHLSIEVVEDDENFEDDEDFEE
jgi:hypothetical protein